MATVIIGLAILAIIIITKMSVVLSKTACKSTVSMAGKLIIITGANHGLGFETAKDLAKRGGRIILACRNKSKALEARDRIIKDTGNTNIVYKHLDLASLQSVRRFAEEVISTEQQLNVLINNAGVWGYGDRYTTDGIVEGMQVNYFGVFLLTLLLLPLLKKTGGRIVNVNSTMHFFGRVNLRHVNEKGYYWSAFTYANSKLCMLIFTVELAKRLEGSGVTVNASHPGIINTNLLSTSSVVEQFGNSLLNWMAGRNDVEGAQTSIYLAVAEEVSNVTGKFFIDCKERYMHWKVADEQLAAELWNYSENMVELEVKL